MQSYCVGDWGLAVDLGIGGRFWGSRQLRARGPARATLILGMPFGFQVALGADVFDVGNQMPTAKGGFAALELDLLRLTTMRSGQTTKTFVNPSPANAPRRPRRAAPQSKRRFFETGTLRVASLPPHPHRYR